MSDKRPDRYEDGRGMVYPVGVAKLASKALVSRPWISLRMRLIMGFSIIFVVALGVVVAAWWITARIDDKLEFVERADRFANEIQQCRRYEKNYLLYGTGRSALVRHLGSARKELLEVKVELSRVIGAARIRRLERQLKGYARIVESMMEGRAKGPPKAHHVPQIEAQLREHGGRLVAAALALSKEERDDVRHHLHLMRQSTLVILAVFLIVMIVIANFMARHLITRLRHVDDVLKRVGDGDFSPITPVRKYQDEFSSLSVTMNHMMEELVKRHEQLVQSRKIAAVGTLTAGIAHEINNPVNNISLVLESLVEDGSEMEEQERQRLYQEALNQSDRVADIVKNLLEFSRSNHPLMKQVSLEALIDSTVRLVSNEMKLNSIKLTRDVEGELPEIHADKGGLQQVLLNILLNAIHAMPQGGEIEIALGRSDDDEARLDITDTGVGIKPEDLGNIFDPFYTTKPDSEGTGLGLSVSYSIVQKHGGRIAVKSTPGKGTTFSIFLPLSGSGE